MLREMCWLPLLGTDGDKILHLRTSPSQPWQPYTSYPQFSVPDYKIPKGTKGWATYQKLMREKWTLVHSERALQTISLPNQKLDQRKAS